MATKSYLSKDQIKEAQSGFLRLSPTSIRKSFSEPKVAQLSRWMGEKLFESLTAVKDWQLSEPIALGSWARDELSPRSDIDLLFVGEETYVKKVVQHFQEAGLPIRSRVPKNPKDWSVGVEEFDVLALLRAKALCPAAEMKLDAQLKKLRPRIQKNSKSYLKAMLQERKERNERYDSMTNYLEPNLKFGPGGLRDLDQAMSCLTLFPEKYEERSDIVQRLGEFKQFLLMVRQRLHLLGYQDVLAAQAQQELYELFGYLNIQEFMSEVQFALSEVAFYADWMIEKAQVRVSKELPDSWSLNSALEFLNKKASTIHQESIRSANLSLPPAKNIGRLLNKYWVTKGTEENLRSAFRARIPHRIFKELERVSGLVQHDQYHRYAVDAHSLQVMREVQRLRKKHNHLGKKLESFVKSLSARDWEILLWTALYHDLCKGRQGDHSTEGAKLSKKEMTKLGFSLRTTVEVSWMVENHLLISKAAFKMNPREPATWQTLFDEGVRKRRIVNLGIFTALDIRGTNPDAWNDWKSGLLAELLENLQSPKASKYLKIIEKYEKDGQVLDKKFFNSIDPRLIEKLPVKLLAEDVAKLKKLKEPADPLVIAEDKNRYWIRFHWPEDKDGLFLSFVHAIHSAGGSVSEAFIQSYEDQGVYDWFRISSSSNKTMLSKLLSKLIHSEIDPDWPEPKFEKISLVQHKDGEAIISFRGKDQRGALMGAAHALYEAGMPIIWAKVNTWGRQLDDVFAVRADEKRLEEFFEGPATRLMS